MLAFGRRAKAGLFFEFSAIKALIPLAAVIAAGLAVSGCSELPSAAPTVGEVVGSSHDPADGIVVLDLNQPLLDALAATHPATFVGRFTSKAPAADLKVSVGDTLQIAVFEQSSGGLFSRPSDPASAGSFGSAPILPVIVARDGDISVPYAGRIRAAKRSLEEIRADIERKLVDKAVNPQVQVELANGSNTSANSATVGGDVSHSGVFALRPSGTRLLDLIAEAGGERFPPYESTVHLTRGKREAAVYLQRVVDRSDENIFAYPGDNIFVTHDPKTFTVLGATTKVGRYGFSSEKLNLAEAVAEAGGFMDQISDPSGVFVFRYESTRFVGSVKTVDAPLTGEKTPVIYRVNLLDSDGFFRARQFMMRDKDIVLIATADATQFQKVLNLLLSASAVGVNVRALIPTTNGSSSIVTTTVVSPTTTH